MTLEPSAYSRLSAGLMAIGVASGAACSGPDVGSNEIPLPDVALFAPVSEALSAGCGSLDCHGQIGRNLRLYGANGLRLDPALKPGGGLMTEAEVSANFASVVLLEPELTSFVFSQKGVQLDQLTLVRKGRGAEHHKGGAAMDVGGSLDRCLASWFRGAIDTEACLAASEVHRPGAETVVP